MAPGTKSIGLNAGYNLAGAAIPLLLSLITVPLYLRLVGADRYGVLAIAWLLLGYFGLFDLGLGRATSFRMAALRDAPPESRATTLWSAIVINLALGLVGAIILWAVASWFFAHVFKVTASIRAEITDGVPLLAMAVPIATLTGVLTGALQGREQFLRTNVVSVVSTALFQVFPLIVVWLYGPYLPTLLASAIAARVIALMVLCLFCWREVARGHPIRLDRQRLQELLSFAGWVSITSLFAPFLLMADRFLIGGVLGAVAVTTYTVPFQLAQRIGLFPTSLAHALFPRLSAAGGEEHRRLGALALRTLAALMTPAVVVAIIAIEPFLNIWVGPEMGSASAPVGRVIILGFWVNAFAVINLVRLQSMGRPDLVAKTHAAEAIPYLVAMLAMMYMFGLMGCAITFLARCIIEYFVLSYMVEGRLLGNLYFLANLLFLSAVELVPIYTTPLSPSWVLLTAAAIISTSVSCYYFMPFAIRLRISTTALALCNRLR